MSKTNKTPLQIFIQGSNKQLQVFHGFVGQTVKDIKIFLKKTYDIPTYEQRLVYCTYLSDNTKLTTAHNLCTFSFCLGLCGGPEMLLVDNYSEVAVTIACFSVYKRLKLDVKPYWYIGGQTGVISRIIECFEETIHLDPNTLQLVYLGKRIPFDRQLCDFITGGYLQFTTNKTLCKRYGVTPNTTYYGWMVPLNGTERSQGKILTLESFNPNTPDWTIPNTLCCVCKCDSHQSFRSVLLCKHVMCSTCVENTNRCPICDKSII